jgi:hypothetical protein
MESNVIDVFLTFITKWIWWISLTPQLLCRLGNNPRLYEWLCRCDKEQKNSDHCRKLHSGFPVHAHVTVLTEQF